MIHVAGVWEGGCKSLLGGSHGPEHAPAPLLSALASPVPMGEASSGRSIF